jgi:hypothetical protein
MHAMSARATGTRVLFALLGAFIAVTLVWLVWGLTIPGDYFDAGNPVGWGAIAFGAAGGATLGWRMRSRAARVAFGVAGLASLLFWVAVPDGWWALPPPRPGQVRAP